jgi:acid phosphatase
LETMLWLGPSTSISILAALGYAVADTHEVDLRWYPPRNTSVNDLETALHGDGVYGFIFNTSSTPEARYGTYNWCNMPHVRKSEYVKPSAEYKLKYVEMVSLALDCWLFCADSPYSTREMLLLDPTTP